MSEPKRWLEHAASRDIERLIRAARAEEPGEDSLRHTLSAVGVVVGASMVAASAAASAGSAGTSTSAVATAKVGASITGSVLAKWTALGATIGTLGVGGVAIVTRLPSEGKPGTSSAIPTMRAASGLSVARAARSPAGPRPSSVVAAPALPTIETADQGERDRALADRTAMPSAAASPIAPLDRAMTVTATDRPSHAVSSVAPSSGVPLEAETLAEEVQSVDRARAALAAGRPRETLALLDDYERRFHARGFAPETLYLRMEASTSLGQTAQALAAAERLLEKYPNSPQAARARLVLSKNRDRFGSGR